eukprot:3861311-Alexandrium_andersonii.AAC.1
MRGLCRQKLSLPTIDIDGPAPHPSKIHLGKLGRALPPSLGARLGTRLNQGADHGLAQSVRPQLPEGSGVPLRKGLL